MSQTDARVAVVTGSARGIGRSIVQALADDGWSTVINYASSAGPAEELARQLEERDQPAITVQGDVGTPEGAQTVIAAALERFGRVTLLVNNAGITRDRTLRRMSVDDWREVMRVNLDSAFYCTKAVLPHMIERGGGSIINISSVIGQMGNLGQANYAASKAGMIGFAKAAALELARYNITVNAICPGFVESDMLEQVPDEILNNLLDRIPLHRFGRPEEVARGVVYLVNHGQYMTGQTLNLNGGLFSLVG